MNWKNFSRKPVFKALTLGLFLTGGSAFANTFNIDVSDDDIAIDANNASVMELLKELENLTGIPVKFVAETKERITLNLGLTNIETAIGKITPNHLIVHKNEDGKSVIEELIIIPADSDLVGSGSGSDFLPQGDPAPAIVQTPANNQNQPTIQPADQIDELQTPADSISATPASGTDGEVN